MKMRVMEATEEDIMIKVELAQENDSDV